MRFGKVFAFFNAKAHPISDAHAVGRVLFPFREPAGDEFSQRPRFYALSLLSGESFKPGPQWTG